MSWELTKREYNNFCVARSDSQDYDMSGYAAIVVDENKAALVHIGHCSCYGTFDAYNEESTELSGGTVAWQGTLQELLSLANRKADPEMEGRILVEADYDSNYLLGVYKQLLEKYQSK